MTETGVEVVPVVSVIVVTWNSEPDLRGCLASLEAEADAVPLEIICVDNSSEDESVAVARAAGAEVVANRSNLGFPAAVNVGLRRARGDNVLLLNPDVELDGRTIRRCVEVLCADPTIGMVGCNLRGPDGRPDRAAARRVRSLGAIAVEAFGLPRVSPLFDFQYFPRWSRRTSRDVPCIHGAFALLPTGLLRELGGLDEAAFMYLEDTELCRQITARGLRIRFVADAGGVHRTSAGTTRASAERQAAAYLHRLDADLELMRRRRGEPGRLAALVLLSVRSLAGLAVAVVRRRRDLGQRYVAALGWLAGQGRARVPPRPVP